MPRSLGEMLDEPGEFPLWIQHSVVAFSTVLAADRLGLLDPLDQGPASIAAIAAQSGCPEHIAARLLGFLASEGVLEIDAEGVVHPTARTAALRATEQHRLAALTFATGLELAEATRSGVTAFEERFGTKVFDYFRDNPADGAMFGRVMSETTAQTERFIFANHAFRPFELAVDVGGSQGSLLARLLDAHPGTRGILFDLPGTVKQAEAALAGSNVGERIDFVGGNFFDSVPAGGDLYLLKQILHDWSDEECLTILRNIRAAAGKGARLAVMERLIPERYEPHNAYVVDIIMLLWTSGRERRLSECRAMLAEAGFAVERVAENPAGMSIFEAVAV
jgi:hypothetical protein